MGYEFSQGAADSKVSDDVSTSVAAACDGVVVDFFTVFLIFGAFAFEGIKFVDAVGEVCGHFDMTLGCEVEVQ